MLPVIWWVEARAAATAKRPTMYRIDPRKNKESFGQYVNSLPTEKPGLGEQS